jgi:BirA family biotin operon repressor/biotin-[acetyl-CoA-carboxylase] ligase
MKNDEEDQGIHRAAVPLEIEKLKESAETCRLGKQIHYFVEIESTNAYAFKRAQEGGTEGEIVVSESQTRGKGRMGRHWVSPAYLNLYFSVILRPKVPPAHAPQLTLMSAVAVAETVQSFLPYPPEIKWPNDILVRGKKLAGILTESSCQSDKILFVIIGIGVNLNFTLALMPEAIQDRATSIRILTQKPVNRTAFMQRLIHNLDKCYGDFEDKGFSVLAHRWESFFALKGKNIKIQMTSSPDQAIRGKAIGIDGDGALTLQDDRGVLRRIIAGEVFPADS